MAATKQKHRKKSKGLQKRLKGLSEKIKAIIAPFKNPALPEFRAGDTLKVHVKIKEGEKERIQIFEGVVISRTFKSGHGSFTIRKISHGVGVERLFMETSPKIFKIEMVQQGKVRRAKLYYLRALAGKAARIEKRA